MKMHDVIRELEEYIAIEYTQHTEFCQKLIELYNCSAYSSGKNFLESIENELKFQLENFKAHCKIVEVNEPVVYITRHLEWTI